MFIYADICYMFIYAYVPYVYICLYMLYVYLCLYMLYVYICCAGVPVCGVLLFIPISFFSVKYCDIDFNVFFLIFRREIF